MTSSRWVTELKRELVKDGLSKTKHTVLHLT